MAEYQYQAIDKLGKKKKGIIEASSLARAQSDIEAKQYCVIRLKEKSASQGWLSAWNIRLRRRVPTTFLLMFTRDLATLVSSGVPIAESLEAIACAQEKPVLRTRVRQIKERLCEGYALADSLSQSADIFDHTYIATVRAGEASGHLATVLTSLASSIERRQHIHSKITQALLYPAIVTTVAICIIAFLLSHVVPDILQVFTDQDQALPLATVVLIGLSHFCSQYGLLCLFAVLALIVGLRQGLRIPRYRLRFDGLLLRIPFCGRLIMAANLSRYLETLAVLTGAGVPLHEGLGIALKMVKNTELQQCLDGVRKQVGEGVSFYHALGQVPRMPAVTCGLIKSGEISGSLAQALSRGAQAAQRHLETVIDTGLILFEPAMILTMGGIVLFIVLAILLPIFAIEQVPL